MNVIAHGVDFVQIERVAQMVARHGRRMVERVFTPAEQAYCRGRAREMEHLAGRFAAKEAVLKALGTGWRGGIAWTDIEVTNAQSGRPLVGLSGRCAEIARALGIGEILISISHIDTHAMASAIALAAEETGGEA